MKLTYPLAALTLASLASAPARADFFDDLRRTFQTDIPHFFQDDIPCAFGGQPTSHTKTSCKDGDRKQKPAAAADKPRAQPVADPPVAKPDDAPPNSPHE